MDPSKNAYRKNGYILTKDSYILCEKWSLQCTGKPYFDTDYSYLLFSVLSFSDIGEAAEILGEKRYYLMINSVDFGLESYIEANYPLS